MRVSCLISSILIALSAIFQNIACSPSLVIISNEIIVTSRKPAFYHFSSANPYSTKSPLRNPSTPSRNGDNWPRPVTYGQPTPSSTRQDRTVRTEKSKLQDVTPSGGTRGFNISATLDEVLLRAKRRAARGGTFGNTGRHGPRDRLDYSSSLTHSINHLLLATSLFTCLILVKL